MLRVLLATSGLRAVWAQCGPGGTNPYPPGSSTCPPPPGGGAPTPGGGAGSGPAPSCTSPPCAAPLLGDIAFSTVAGTDPQSGTIPVKSSIFGPFENGFNSQQDNVLSGLGCATGAGYIGGGIDTQTAEQMVAYQCNVTLPRGSGTNYISLLDQCGGHTKYHFHEKLRCLYTDTAGSTHSTQVGQGYDGKYIYGKWENFSATSLPALDACGGHFGKTPDSNGVVVYHYHVQDKPPFTIGCYGPKVTGTNMYEMLKLADCQKVYAKNCSDGDTRNLTTSTGTRTYDPWCPCYDATGSNTGTQELPVFSMADTFWKCSGASCIWNSTAPGSPSPSPTPTPSPTANGTGSASTAWMATAGLVALAAAFLPMSL